ncbi:esterase-like activity of phytase family protein [Hoeflea ulvae]|uniref:Esterase-like activity of phytase family protein n=1 Tax=Hoeflea ulvae TaxID=2983764 RepID=A0ABT3Y9P5_9HYPH|nr:esterase-like activity of phytase family protein [Hoeflea ulvae]
MVRLGLIAGVVALLTATTALPLRADDETLQIRSRLIPNFRVGSDEIRFGAFEFTGGLELSSSHQSLGAMSAIRLAEDRGRFLGVMDTGNWYAGRFERDDKGRLIGVTDFSVSPIIGANGDSSDEKWKFDAEGLALRGDEALVSFERVSRVDIYPAMAPGKSKPLGSLPVVIPLKELRHNRGLEAIAVAPPASPLAGAVIAVSEKSLNASGDIYAAILSGRSTGVFFVKRHPPFDVTDGDFLPNGDLLLLERRFSIAEGVGMRIRRIDGSRLGVGNLVDGPVILEADFGDQIDNMEGLDVSTDAEGQIYVTLVSDDNHSILQRNLILEFRYMGEAK